MTAMYRLFGLNVRSEIDLPELTPCAIEAEPEVTIRLSDIGADVSAPGLHAVDGDLVFVAEDVARYRIAAGRTIVVERLPNSPARNVRLFLLGSAFGALLHQRGLLPLHANAVEIGGKAVAFMGESGAGKSNSRGLVPRQWLSGARGRCVRDRVRSERRAARLPGATAIAAVAGRAGIQRTERPGTSAALSKTLRRESTSTTCRSLPGRQRLPICRCARFMSWSKAMNS